MSRKTGAKERKTHTEKVLKNMNKNAQTASPVVKSKVSSNVDPSLKDQYNVIRKDLLKLREDLAKGYDMTKNLVEKKGLWKQILSAK
ncbi:hypothetical protein [Peredibacter starrii]|uniref:Uncharacterized protein n=1 Tax=Peredibacter starrii TaxID=28202 RepID=A0AAX4HQW3_9BACT|nr:hypothetical protein [Peredibacter starrii]WPU65445.1 hypothetical protein SOO65_01660 [Peredibacter starrii]